MKAQLAPTCVSMLSTPLKSALPSNTLTLLEQLCTRAVQSLSCNDIRSVYRALSGLETCHLDDLAPHILARFQGSLNDLLAKLDINDPFANLLCLAILAKFASSPCKASAKGSITMEESLQSDLGEDRFSPARKYFTGKRAQTTLSLAVLKVINACSPKSELKLSEAMETLTLSLGILDAINSEDKVSWMSKNQLKTKKLYEKIDRPAINKNLQCAALDFVVALSEARELPTDMRVILEGIFCSSSSGNLSPRTLTMCIKLLDPSIVSNKLITLLRLACEPITPDGDALSSLDSNLRTVSAIATLISELEIIRTAVHQKLKEPENISLLARLGSQRYDLKRHGCSEVCPFFYAETKSCLHQRFLVLILGIGLNCSPSDYGLKDALACLLESQLGRLAARSPHEKCENSKVRTEPAALSLFEASSTPRTQSVSHDWKDKLFTELSRDVRHQHGSVTRMVGEICRDLELRCGEAEQPFRDEQRRAQNLQTQLEDSRSRVSELEAHAQSQTSELNDIKNERNHLSDQVEAMERRLQDLSSQLEQIHQELDWCRADHERSAQAVTEKSRQQDLEYMSILTGKDLLIEEQAAKLATSEDRIEGLENKLSQQETSAIQTINSNELIIQDLSNDVLLAKELAAARQLEVDRLAASNSQLITSKEELARHAEEDSEQHAILVADLRAQITSQRDRNADLEQRHAQHMDGKDAELQRLADVHQSAVEKLQIGLEEAHHRAEREREERFSQISDLKKEIKGLRRQREKQAEEVAEARALKNGFMAFMGNIKDQPGSGHTYSPQASHPSITGTPEEPAAGPVPTASSTSSTSSKSGPTPKRMKRHRASFQKYTTKPKKSDGSAGSVRRTPIKAHRTPLADLGVGLSLTQLTPTQRVEWTKPHLAASANKQALKENDEIQVWHSDDESFGGEDIFTSTNQRQLSALRNRTSKPVSDGYDETTAEF